MKLKDHERSGFSIFFPVVLMTFKLIRCNRAPLFRVATCQGKVREKQNFVQAREAIENMSGNFGPSSNVSLLSGTSAIAITIHS